MGQKNKIKSKKKKAAAAAVADASSTRPSSTSKEEDEIIAWRPAEYTDAETARRKLADQDEVSCWICMDVCEDEYNLPPLRDCSCRGSAGFYHLKCLQGYSERRCLELVDMSNDKFTMDPDLMRRHFLICPTCHQPYVGDLEIAMAAMHVRFTSGIDLPALMLKWLKLESNYDYLLKLGNFPERAKKLGHFILETMKNTRRNQIQTFALRSATTLYYQTISSVTEAA